jgi:IS30 family transposase
MPEIAMIYRKEELKAIIKECLIEHETESAEKVSEIKSYSINQAAKQLGRHHSTIKKLIKTGQIVATSDHRITLAELNRYLAGCKKSK